jgi:RNase H-fold protein (predicted Holliday junction resolvase)
MTVIWGGTNDIVKNETNNGLAHITNFVNSRKHTNIVIVGAPVRFDLLATSCVNKEVIAYNKNVHKRVKQFECVKVIGSELQRKYFTKHSLHMNRAGKEQMAQKIAEQVRETFLRGKYLPSPYSGNKILSRGQHRHGNLILEPTWMR